MSAIRTHTATYHKYKCRSVHINRNKNKFTAFKLARVFATKLLFSVFCASPVSHIFHFLPFPLFAASPYNSFPSFPFHCVLFPLPFATIARLRFCPTSRRNGFIHIYICVPGIGINLAARNWQWRRGHRHSLCALFIFLWSANKDIYADKQHSEETTQKLLMFTKRNEKFNRENIYSQLSKRQRVSGSTISNATGPHILSMCPTASQNSPPKSE